MCVKQPYNTALYRDFKFASMAGITPFLTFWVFFLSTDIKQRFSHQWGANISASEVLYSVLLNDGHSPETLSHIFNLLSFLYMT
jgi:hypothetical protein